MAAKKTGNLQMRALVIAVSGPLFTLASIVFLNLFERLYPDALLWPPVLMAALAYSGFVGGVIPGIISWVGAAAYFFFTTAASSPEGLTPQSLTTIFSVSAAMLFPVLALGLIRRQLESNAQARERKAIEQSEEKYRSLFELAPDVVYTINALGRLDSLSPSFTDVSGYPVEDWLGRSFLEIVHPEDRKRALSAFTQSMTGKNVNVELRAIGAHGQIIEIDIRSRPRRENGFITGSIGYARDVTKSRRAERDLRSRTLELAAERNRAEEERSRLETIVNSIGDSVFAVDKDGQIILMNRVAEQLAGATLQQARGKYYTEVFRFVEEGSPERSFPDFVKKVIASGSTARLPMHSLLLRPDGNTVPVSDIAAPYRDDDGNVLGAVVAFHDYTRERELERAKDEFISVASHQLRTPLGSMRWTTEMLLGNGEIPDTLRPAISQLLDNMLRMINLVNDLLDVSRIDQNRIPDHSQSIRPEETIAAVLNEVKKLADSQQVTLIFQPPTEKLEIWFDPDRFHDVVENLISNAVKYSRPGGSVTITMERQENVVRLRITDTGIGIPASGQHRIFQKFFRADNAVEKDPEGSGLGLFVVKSYVEKWGGTIDFESEEGKGTSFSVDLPLHSGDTSTGEEHHE